MTASAHGTLLSFLDAPEARPPEDWAAAAAHSNSEATLESDGLVERARLARERAQRLEHNVARLEGSRTPVPTVDRATGVLVAGFNVSNARAHECLLWVSEQAGTELSDVARRFMDRVDALGLRSHQREALLDVLSELATSADDAAT